MTHPADPSVLPSPPTSPTFPNRTAATRIRIKTPRPVSTSISSTPRTTNAERTRSASPSLSWTDGVPSGPEIKAAASAASAVASKRRQSSIAYYTPASPSPWSQRLQLNRSMDHVEPRENLSKRSSLVLSSRAPSTRASISSSEATGAREREPLTLVEKHADLLHFIAQKERKCLELRDQLAAHEKELAELKRKWGGIVNHGDPLPNTSTPGIGTVTLGGLKEGVRMITAGFSDLGGVIQELESGDDTASKFEGQPSAGAARDNSSASNAHASRANSEHLSTSSTSSIQGGASTSDHVRDDRDRELMTTATAPSLSRAGSLNYRIHKRTSRVISQESTTPPSSMPASPSSESPKSGALDVGMSLVLAPSPTLVPPLLGAASESVYPPFPPTTGSMSSWMDSMGKKLSELHKGQTFSKSQKRASSLLAGVSSTISSALLPGPTATTPAPVPRFPTTTVRPRTKSSVTKRPPSPQFRSQSDSRAYPSYKSMTDWLDDDEDEHTVHAGGVSVLDAKLKSRRTTEDAVEHKEADTTATAVSPFDDDWNW